MYSDQNTIGTEQENYWNNIATLLELLLYYLQVNHRLNLLCCHLYCQRLQL